MAFHQNKEIYTWNSNISREDFSHGIAGGAIKCPPQQVIMGELGLLIDYLSKYDTKGLKEQEYRKY